MVTFVLTLRPLLSKRKESESELIVGRSVSQPVSHSFGQPVSRSVRPAWRWALWESSPDFCCGQDNCGFVSREWVVLPEEMTDLSTGLHTMLTWSLPQRKQTTNLLR